MSATNDPIVSVLRCDDHYVRHAAATIVSIIRNKPWYYPQFIVNFLSLQLFRAMKPDYYYAVQTPWASEINQDANLYLIAKALWQLAFQPLERFFKRYFRSNK